MQAEHGSVVKVIEVIGSSTTSFSDAVRNAVRTASATVRNITGVDVLSSSADVGPDGELTSYKVDCKIAFVIESGDLRRDLAEMAAEQPAEPPYLESGPADQDR
jgi:flavin-binding protein dodecin